MNEFLDTKILSYKAFELSVGNLLHVLIIFFVTYILIQLVIYMARRRTIKKQTSDLRYISLAKLISYIFWTLGILLSFQAMGINVTFLIASSAALLVGIGLGLQNVFRDFVSGIILLLEGTIKVNDIVEVDDMVVRVKEVSLRTSKVVTREDNVLIVPNHIFTDHNVLNWTHNTNPSRFQVDVGVDYQSDPRKVEEIMIKCALSDEDVIKDGIQKPTVRFYNFGESALEFQLLFWSNNQFKIESTKSRLRHSIFQAFRQNNISIPFPQRVVHHRNQ